MNKNSLFIKIGTSNFLIPYNEILYIESVGRKLIVTTIKKEYCFYGSLKSIIKSLPDNFLQPHNSYIVNSEHITGFYKNMLYLDQIITLPVSRTYKHNVKKFFSNINPES